MDHRHENTVRSLPPLRQWRADPSPSYRPSPEAKQQPVASHRTCTMNNRSNSSQQCWAKQSNPNGRATASSVPKSLKLEGQEAPNGGTPDLRAGPQRRSASTAPAIRHKSHHHKVNRITQNPITEMCNQLVQGDMDHRHKNTVRSLPPLRW